jgi:putative cardiolipin synthase
VSPYFIPGERGVAILCEAARRGVRVRVLTNSLASTDVPLVHAAYARMRPALLACGVALHELRPRTSGERRRFGFSSGASLHAKVVAIDRRIVLVGSLNLDPRSRTLNTEVALFIESEGLGGRIGQLFDDAASPDQSWHLRLAGPPAATASLLWEGLEEGHPIRLDDEPQVGWWRRLLGSTVGAWTPTGLL